MVFALSLFFFSSRRRHTRWTGDWSSDVCSSDLSARVIDMHTVKPIDREAIAKAAAETKAIVVAEEHLVDGGLGVRVAQVVAETRRSEERRVGKECRSGRGPECQRENSGGV